jgi:hypothetical protein
LLPDEFDLATATAIVRPRRARSVERLTGGGGNSAIFEIGCSDGSAVIVKVYSDLLHWKLEKEVFVYDLSGKAAPRLPCRRCWPPTTRRRSRRSAARPREGALLLEPP